jgi:hypothetical protein
MNRWFALLLVGSSLGCTAEGVDEKEDVASEPLSSCALSVTMTGTIDSTIPEDATMDCAALGNGETGIDNVFLLSSGVAQLEIMIDSVSEGEVGGSFPTTINLYDITSRRWGTDTGACSVEITEHTLDSVDSSDTGELRNYVVAGTGTCSGDAVPRGQGAHGVITLSEFSFRLPPVWRD